MDLSKAFDCIPHDLIIAKLAAYGFKRETLRLIYSYLKGWKQCVKINNTYSDLRFLYNDYSISYEGLLEKAGKVKMNVYRLRNLCAEAKLNPKLNPKQAKSRVYEQYL